MRHAVPAHRRYRTGLSARGDDEFGRAVDDRVDGDRSAQRGIDHRHGDRAVQVVAIADKYLVLLFVDLDVQVARGPATGTDLALGGQPHPHSVADTGRDLHADVPSRPDAAVTAAAVAWVGDDLAHSSAYRARPRRHHLAEQRPLDGLDLTAPATGVAGDRRRVAVGALALAQVAQHSSVDRHLLRHARGAFGKVKTHAQQ